MKWRCTTCGKTYVEIRKPVTDQDGNPGFQWECRECGKGVSWERVV